MTALASPAHPALAPVISKLADLVAELMRVHAEEMTPREAAELAATLHRLAPAEVPSAAPARPVHLMPVADRAKAAVLAVDDRPLLAQGIRRVLESTPDFYLAGHSASMRAAAEDVRALAPDVVLLNPRTGGEFSAPELCRRVRVGTPQVRVLVLGDGGNAALLTACQKAGARGVLPLGCTEVELVRALRDVLAPAAAGAGPADPQPPESVHERLRPREYDVLRLLAAGAGTTDVAARLGITTNTVRSYTQSLMAKLQAHNRVQLLLSARRLGLL